MKGPVEAETADTSEAGVMGDCEPLALVLRTNSDFLKEQHMLETPGLSLQFCYFVFFKKCIFQGLRFIKHQIDTFS